MMRSLFGRGRKKPEPRGQSAGESIRDARVGDVVVVQGLDLDYDEVYFLVENLHRYGGNGIIWYELVLADAEKRSGWSGLTTVESFTSPLQTTGRR